MRVFQKTDIPVSDLAEQKCSQAFDVQTVFEIFKRQGLNIAVSFLTKTVYTIIPKHVPPPSLQPTFQHCLITVLMEMFDNRVDGYGAIMLQYRWCIGQSLINSLCDKGLMYRKLSGVKGLTWKVGATHTRTQSIVFSLYTHTNNQLFL